MKNSIEAPLWIGFCLWQFFWALKSNGLISVVSAFGAACAAASAVFALQAN